MFWVSSVTLYEHEYISREPVLRRWEEQHMWVGVDTISVSWCMFLLLMFWVSSVTLHKHEHISREPVLRRWEEQHVWVEVTYLLVKHYVLIIYDFCLYAIFYTYNILKLFLWQSNFIFAKRLPHGRTPYRGFWVTCRVAVSKYAFRKHIAGCKETCQPLPEWSDIYH